MLLASRGAAVVGECYPATCLKCVYENAFSLSLPLPVNDLGGSRSGEGNSRKSADIVVDEIVKAGGKAVADYSKCYKWWPLKVHSIDLLIVQIQLKMAKKSSKQQLTSSVELVSDCR